jgi:C-terminal processing protease CtpA/Prc
MADVARSRVAVVVAGLLALGLAVCAGLIVHGGKRIGALREENAALREAARRVEELQRENQRLQTLQVEHDELERYRKQAEEVHQLRAQYQEWQRLQQDYAALQQDHERLRQALAGATGAAGGAAPANRGVWIGIGLRPGSDPAGGVQGVAVASVIPGGPAANSGLRPGDFIVAVNGKAVASVAQVKDEIRAKPAGTAVLVEVMREGTRLQFSAVAEPLPAFE